MSLGYGTPRTIQLLRTLSIPILRHALSCSGITPALRKTWNRVMSLCLPGLGGVGPAAYHAQELFGWPANADSLDCLAVRAAIGALTRTPLHPTRVISRNCQLAQLSGSNVHLSGWLQFGAWQAWADALTLCCELKVASWTSDGLQLHVQGTALAKALFAHYVPRLASARVFAERRVVQLWDGIVPRPLHFSEVAVRAVRSVALKCSPAASSAVLKLLTKHRDMPVRDGQHICCFCGGRHFYTTVASTIMRGCFRARLSSLSDFRWLASESPDVWHYLVVHHSTPQLAMRLGHLSRVLSEALQVNRWDEPCNEPAVLLRAFSRIQLRSSQR
eukprot:6475631-Amphidinium_carterae.1